MDILLSGTCKAAVPYKIGEKTADVMLEILNLDKKETISMDVISNQEISEVLKDPTLLTYSFILYQFDSPQ